MNASATFCDYRDKIEQTAPSPSDLQLIGLIAGGDEQALGELYQRYSAPIYGYLLRLVREEAEAEDLLQEVFVAVWRGAGGYRGQAKVRTWLYRIAHHRAVSWLRRHKAVSSFDEMADPSGEGEPEETAIGAWRNRQVRQALERLSPKQRAVVELSFVHDLSYAEIAEVVGCPVGTVKSRMSYALRSLNGVLKGMGVVGKDEEGKT